MSDSANKETIEKKSCRISVRELVEYRQKSGDLDATFFASPRAVEGIRLHQKIQKCRGAEYTSELPVSWTVESGDVELAVSGRIDGVFEYPDRVVVEEIKTTRKDPDTLEIAEDHPYWAQVKCYGYMLACKKNLERIDLQLTCCNADTEKIRELGRTFAFEELEAFFNALADACLKKIRAALAWGEKSATNRRNFFNFPSKISVRDKDAWPPQSTGPSGTRNSSSCRRRRASARPWPRCFLP